MMSRKKKYSCLWLCFLVLGLAMTVSAFGSEEAVKSTVVQEETNSVVEEDVYLDFRDTDIKEVARVISKMSGKSILVSQGISASVTVNLSGIPWRQALDIILKTYHLAIIEDGDFLIIVSYDQVRAQETLAPLKTEIVSLNFANMQAVNSILSGSLTSRGSVQIDERTKSLIITDTEDVINNVKKILERIDTSTPQVLIEVLMVDKKLVDSFDLGVTWTLTDLDPTRNHTLSQTPATFGDLTLNYGRAMFGRNYLSAVVRTWKKNDMANIIANPRILTLDNENASIELVEQVSYDTTTQTSDGGLMTSQAFLDIGIKLNVTPQITQDGHVLLDLDTEQNFQTGLSSNNIPIIDTRRATSKMMVNNEETIIIGGLRRKNKASVVNKVPLLGDIPLIGNAFKTTDFDETITDLIIFVTPVIYKDSIPLSEYERLEKEKLEGKVEKEVTEDNEFYFIEEDERTTAEKTQDHYEEIKVLDLDPAFDKLEMMPLKAPY